MWSHHGRAAVPRVLDIPSSFIHSTNVTSAYCGFLCAKPSLGVGERAVDKTDRAEGVHGICVLEGPDRHKCRNFWKFMEPGIRRKG